MIKIDYQHLMRQAWLYLIAQALECIAKHGAPLKSEILIVFKTVSTGVEMPVSLRNMYPETMTIVLQHWFEDLKIGDGHFYITLSFNGVPERLKITFDSIVSFVDVESSFGLKFDLEKPPTSQEDSTIVPTNKNENEQQTQSAKSVNFEPARVISLDQFRPS